MRDNELHGVEVEDAHLCSEGGDGSAHHFARHNVGLAAHDHDCEAIGLKRPDKMFDDRLALSLFGKVVAWIIDPDKHSSQALIAVR
jgi:hypothetical protein